MMHFVTCYAEKSGLWRDIKFNPVPIEEYFHIIDEIGRLVVTFSPVKCKCCTGSSCRFESHCGPFAGNLEQVANLWCAQVNLASYPLWEKN